MIRPRFYAYLLFLVLIWLGTHFGNWRWANLLLFFFLLLPLFSLLSSLLQRRKIQITALGGEKSIERGQTARWAFELSMEHQWRTLYLSAQFFDAEGKSGGSSDEFRLARGEKFRLYLEMPGRHCGKLKPWYFQLRVLDVLGFFSLKLRQNMQDSLQPVAVTPLSLISSGENNESRSPLEAGEHLSKKSDTDLDEIDRMRPMHSGDRMRSIHWKLSARMQKWMVRQYEKADEAQLCFLLNLPPVGDPENPSAEPLLCLRDLCLDEVSAVAQSFLNDAYKIRLKKHMPWPEEDEIRSMDEYELLRNQLALLPYSSGIDLVSQLIEEQQIPGQRFYVIFSFELDERICSELLLLAASSQGILLYLISPLNVLPREWRTFIRRLARENIKIHLRKNTGRGEQ